VAARVAEKEKAAAATHAKENATSAAATEKQRAEAKTTEAAEFVAKLTKEATELGPRMKAAATNMSRDRISTCASNYLARRIPTEGLSAGRRSPKIRWMLRS
jgi:hypothetical protein